MELRRSQNLDGDDIRPTGISGGIGRNIDCHAPAFGGKRIGIEATAVGRGDGHGFGTLRPGGSHQQNGRRRKKDIAAAVEQAVGHKRRLQHDIGFGGHVAQAAIGRGKVADNGGTVGGNQRTTRGIVAPESTRTDIGAQHSGTDTDKPQKGKFGRTRGRKHGFGRTVEKTCAFGGHYRSTAAVRRTIGRKRRRGHLDFKQTGLYVLGRRQSTQSYACGRSQQHTWSRAGFGTGDSTQGTPGAGRIMGCKTPRGAVVLRAAVFALGTQGV